MDLAVALGHRSGMYSSTWSFTYFSGCCSFCINRIKNYILRKKIMKVFKEKSYHLEVYFNYLYYCSTDYAVCFVWTHPHPSGSAMLLLLNCYLLPSEELVAVLCKPPGSSNSWRNWFPLGVASQEATLCHCKVPVQAAFCTASRR